MKKNTTKKISPKLSKDLHEQIDSWWKGKISEEELEKKATREGFGEGLTTAMKNNKHILALTANLGSSTGLTTIAKKYPERFIDVGVCEQALAGLATGLATEEYTVVTTSFASFHPGRNWDFVRTQIAMSNLPVIVVGSHAGLATGPDGGTHQALEDISLVRSLPNMIVSNPCDYVSAQEHIKELLLQPQPTYVRLAREKTPILFKEDIALSQEKPQTLLKGKGVLLATTGITAFETLKAARILWKEHNINATVLHISQLAPLSSQTLLRKIQTHSHCVSVEDHNIIGGLGSALAELLVGTSVYLERIGIHDAYGQSGTKKELYEHYEIDAQSITKKTLAFLKKK